MFFANHTVVSDLFLAEYIMEGQTNMIGRMLVFCTVPLAALASKFINAGWFVKLGMKKEDFPKFYQYLDDQFDSFRTQ